jgi:hypothetical protein
MRIPNAKIKSYLLERKWVLTPAPSKLWGLELVQGFGTPSVFIREMLSFQRLRASFSL